MRWRSILKLLAGNLLVLVALLVLVEGGARWMESTTKSLFDDPGLRTRGRPFVEPHPDRGFALVPGWCDARYCIDERGFRRGPAAPAGAQTIIALGESTTFGWEVGDAETYPAQLQALFAEHGQPVRVVNAGVPSYSSSQVLRYVRQVLANDTPDLLLIGIMWNDIWYSTVLNWYPDLLVYQQPPRWKTTLLRHSALARLILLQPPPKQAELVDRFNAEALAQYRSNLRGMLEAAAARGVRVALVEPPFAPDRFPEAGLNEFHVRYTKPFFFQTAARYREAASELAAEFHVPVLDHRFSLARGGGPARLFVDPLHPSPEGNHLLAEDVYASIVANRLLPPIAQGTGR